VPHGLKDASKDSATIKRWWRVYPDANIGIPTGAVSGRWVLDVDLDDDPSIDGRQSLATLEAQNGTLPDTIRVSTGSGGWHVYFRHDGTNIPNSTSKLGRGLDVRGDGEGVIGRRRHRPHPPVGQEDADGFRP